MDPIKDKKYLFLAIEGLKAPLPSDWKPIESSKSKEIYYFNFKTGEQLQEHPCDKFYKNKFNQLKQRDLQKVAEAQMEINKNLINEDLFQSSESHFEEESSPERFSQTPEKLKFEEILAGRIRPARNKAKRKEKSQKEKYES